MHKLENPARMAELNPGATLGRIGLKPGDAFVDVGAGTGIFTFEAAKLTNGAVYAVEISGAMLDILREKRESAGQDTVAVVSGIENVPDGACDVALLCTVLHELSDPSAMLRETRRALKPGGLIAVIEFHARPTPFGPPVPHRIGEKQATALLNREGFPAMDRFDLGDNFYCLIARRPAPA